MAFVSARLRSAQFEQLAQRFDGSYRADFFESEAVPAQQFESTFDHLTSFLQDLFDQYFREIAFAAKKPKYIGLPRSLDVLELLIDEEMGGLRDRGRLGVFGAGPHLLLLSVAGQDRKPAEYAATKSEINGIQATSGPTFARLKYMNTSGRVLIIRARSSSGLSTAFALPRLRNQPSAFSA